VKKFAVNMSDKPDIEAQQSGAKIWILTAIVRSTCDALTLWNGRTAITAMRAPGSGSREARGEQRSAFNLSRDS
jgi:hypothetical protein